MPPRAIPAGRGRARARAAADQDSLNQSSRSREHIGVEERELVAVEIAYLRHFSRAELKVVHADVLDEMHLRCNARHVGRARGEGLQG